MNVAVCLKRVLKLHQLDRHGIIQEIADDLGLDRRTISKYYTGKPPTISRSVLGQLCDWLGRRGVPTEELPGLLLGVEENELWPTVANKKGIDFYMGGYQHLSEPAPGRQSVSSCDAAVAADLVELLSRTGAKEDFHPEIRLRYIPLRFPLRTLDPGAQPLADDIAAAKRVFNEMRPQRQLTSAILIGSQRVNYLLELFVAELSGCKPFQTPRKPKVPFYFVYRREDHQTPSCFGGAENPFCREHTSEPGLHYLQKNGYWKACPWDEDRADAGVVIITHNERIRAVEMAIFGFSGRATQALGNELILRQEEFWPLKGEVGNKRIGIYLCRLYFDKKVTASPKTGREFCGYRCRVKALDERVLKKT